jgi:hypothetical protein
MSSLLDLNFSDEADRGKVMQVLHPVSRVPLIGPDELPVSISLLGTDSDVYNAEVNKNRDSNIEELRRRAKYSSAADDNKGARLLAKCTMGWHNIPMAWVDGSQDETPAEFSYDNALKLYKNRGVRWLREQVDEWMADRSNFMKS